MAWSCESLGFSDAKETIVVKLCPLVLPKDSMDNLLPNPKFLFAFIPLPLFTYIWLHILGIPKKRATIVIIHFIDWDFPWNKPSSYWGTPMTMETSIHTSHENPPGFRPLPAAQVLLLDEATSALDAESELQIQSFGQWNCRNWGVYQCLSPWLKWWFLTVTAMRQWTVRCLDVLSWCFNGPRRCREVAIKKSGWIMKVSRCLC